MATDFYSTTSAPVEPSLFAGIEGQEVPVGVSLVAAQGVLPRGSVLKANATGDSWSLVGAAPEATDRLAVLGETTDTGAVGTTEDQIAHAYLTGLFNRAVIYMGDGIDLDAAGEEILRGKGIILDTVVPATGQIPTHA